MPEEVFIIALVAILSGTMMIAGIVKSVFRYLSSRHQPVQPGSSLTTSELERLLRAAVEDATAPLAAKVEALEQRLDRRADRLLGPVPGLQEPPLQEDDEQEAGEPAVRRRRRSR